MLAFLSMVVGALIGFIAGAMLVAYCTVQKEEYFSFYSSSESSVNGNKIKIEKTDTSFKITCKDKDLFKDFIKEHNLNNIKIGDSIFCCDESGSIQIN